MSILGNVYGIKLWIDVRTKLCYLDVSIDGYDDGKLEGLLIGDSMVYTGGKVLESDEGINWNLRWSSAWNYTWKCRLNHTWA